MNAPAPIGGSGSMTTRKREPCTCVPTVVRDGQVLTVDPESIKTCPRHRPKRRKRPTA